jgi:hypothetical protein
MAKDKLTEYSATNESNDVIGDISVAEGMLPSAVNNALREQMTHLKNFSDGTDAIDALAVDNLRLDGNTISSTDTNGNITLAPDGTGVVDVTGTVTADGLTVDGNATIQNTGTPTLTLSDSDGTNQYLRFRHNGNESYIDSRNNTGHGNLYLGRTDGTSNLSAMKISSGGDVSLYADDGTTQGFYWDADQQQLGLGTTAPNGLLELRKSSAAPYFVINRDNDKQWGASVSSGGNLAFQYGTTYANMIASTAAMTITSGGIDVTGTVTADALTIGDGHQIGDETTYDNLVIKSSTDENMVLSAGGTGVFIYKTGSTTLDNGSEKMRLTNDGKLGLGTTSPSAGADVRSAHTGTNLYGQAFLASTDSQAANKGGVLSLGGSYTGTTPTFFGAIGGFKEDSTDGNYGGYLTFATRLNGGSNTERLRITSDGLVGIGLNNPSEQLSLYKSGANNAIQIQSHNSTPGSYNEASLKFALSSSASSTINWDVNAEQTALTVDYEGSEKMRISSSGIVTKPAQPAFRAVSSAGWSIPTSTQTIFPANSAVFNVGGGYNTGTYKFTAPVAGVYYFYGQFFASVSAARGIASIFKNDAQTGGSQTLYLGSTSNGGISYATQCMMQMVAGDTASFQTYQESGGTVTANANAHLSFWYGYLLG